MIVNNYASSAEACQNQFMSDQPDPFSEPFGTIFAPTVAMALNMGQGFDYHGVSPLTEIRLHPAAHALHYGSSCFEGLKAHRQQDGSVCLFRVGDHVSRFAQSAQTLRLPFPDEELVRQMIIDAVEANLGHTPLPPGSLYVRPTLIGTEPNIGAAAAPSKHALLYILNSPVGDYFAGGIRPLTLFVQTDLPRTTPQFGRVKSGANYVMALGPTLEAKADHAADQVLFAPGGDITETGAANFFLIDDQRLITRNLDDSFLHGITRASVITIARELGYTIEERALGLDEVKAWCPDGEVFLSGTAAVVAPVGKLILNDEIIQVGSGLPGDNTLRVRQALTDIQVGKDQDSHNWLTPVLG